MTDSPLATAALRRTALAGADRPATAGAPADAPLSLQERPPAALLQVTAWPDGAAALRAAARERFGLDLPDVGGSAAATGGRQALWVGPLRWWLVEDQAAGPADRADALVAAGAALVDLTCGRARVALRGAAASTVLARLAELDFHPSAFAVGRVAQTVVDHVPALIHRRDAAGFELYLPRSYAPSVWEMLVETAAAFGPRVLPRDG